MRPNAQFFVCKRQQKLNVIYGETNHLRARYSLPLSLRVLINVYYKAYQNKCFSQIDKHYERLIRKAKQHIHSHIFIPHIYYYEKKNDIQRF